MHLPSTRGAFTPLMQPENLSETDALRTEHRDDDDDNRQQRKQKEEEEHRGETAEQVAQGDVSPSSGAGAARESWGWVTSFRARG